VNVLLQRVSKACVWVDGQCVSQINQGLLAYVGIQKADTQSAFDRMVQRLLNYRVFPDSEGRMNLSVLDQGGEVMAISQFTLAADTKKGNRPGFSTAMPPDLAREAFDGFVVQLKQEAAKHGVAVSTGQFQAHMEIESTNVGPINFLLST